MAKKMHELTITANKDYLKLARKMNANKPHMKRARPSAIVEEEDDPADDEVEGDEGEGEGEDDEESDESDEKESHEDFPIIHWMSFACRVLTPKWFSELNNCKSRMGVFWGGSFEAFLLRF